MCYQFIFWQGKINSGRIQVGERWGDERITSFLRPQMWWEGAVIKFMRAATSWDAYLGETIGGGEGSQWLHVFIPSKETETELSTPFLRLWVGGVCGFAAGLCLGYREPEVHQMCVKAFCLLTVLCGLAPSGETPFRCVWIHWVRRWFWVNGDGVCITPSGLNYLNLHFELFICSDL